MFLYTQHATGGGALVEDDALKNTYPIAVLKESENPDLVGKFLIPVRFRAPRKGAPFVCINPGLASSPTFDTPSWQHVQSFLTG
jgi:hypothetical protein